MTMVFLNLEEVVVHLLVLPGSPALPRYSQKAKPLKFGNMGDAHCTDSFKLPVIRALKASCNFGNT